MRVIIYNNSSFGGCFEYGIKINEAYNAHNEVEQSILLLPRNVDKEIPHSQKVLLSDIASGEALWLRKWHFIWRTFANPIILWQLLRKAPASLVIFNDFDQLSALFWVPLFKLTLSKKHLFAVILHDPDRDAYPPGKWLTVPSMKAIISLMHLGLYHEYLPTKPYYNHNKSTQYVSIPHGIYEVTSTDQQLKQHIIDQKIPGSTLFTIVGNIRAEKNYHMAIRALRKFPKMQLMIAGQSANSSVDVEAYKALAKEFGVAERIIWLEKYLSQAEMAAVIEATDVLLLYYSSSFTSQSGVLNTVAPFHKQMIISAAPSSLSAIAAKFGLGVMALADNQLDLEAAIEKSMKIASDHAERWEAYCRYASWQNHVQIVLDVARSITDE
jgi:glycosyltransferase involved in cell wall biosynthesis